MNAPLVAQLVASLLLTADPAPATTTTTTANPAAKAPSKKKAAQKRTAPAPPAAPSPAAPARAVEQPTVGKEVRTIPLSEKQAARVHIVRSAPSYPATIEFPEPFAAAPACGDCGEKNGLFRLDVFNEGHYLTIKPRLFAGQQADGSVIAAQDFLTVLTVRLQTYTLTIQVEYTDDATRADPRVVFTIPSRQSENTFVSAELEKEKKKLEEQFSGRVQRAVTVALLRSFTEPHSCSPLSARNRHEDLVLETKELCVFGARYFLHFALENRGRAGLDLGDTTVKAGADRKSLGEPTEVDRYVATEHLDFQGTSAGVIAFHLEEGQAVPRFLELTVHERGGKGRNITVSLEP